MESTIALNVQYNPSRHVAWARSLRIGGLTPEEIAEEFGVAYEVFVDWANHDLDLLDAISFPASAYVAEAESSLLKRIAGYEYNETSKEIRVHSDGSKTEITKVTKKHVPADTRAIEKFLTSFSPRRYRSTTMTMNLDMLGRETTPPGIEISFVQRELFDDEENEVDV